MRIIAFALCGLLMLAGCNIKKGEKGELPNLEVDVTADAGELPEYEVNWADVEVGTTTKTVNVPKVVVVMEEEEIEVPFIDVEIPNGEEKEERTIMVEAEVDGTEHNLSIREIWASEDNLYVISHLAPLSQSLGDKKMRVSDQITLNAPELNVKHYIVGVRPNRVFNTQYVYVDSMEEVTQMVEDYTVLYKKED